MPTDNSIVAGTTGRFQTSYVPAGAVPPAGAPNPTWAASDPAVALTPVSTDPAGLTVDAAVPAAGLTGGATTFQLGISGPDGAGGAIISGGPITVTVTPAVAPAPTGFGPITQLS